MNLAIIGYGKMGQLLERIAKQRGLSVCLGSIRIHYSSDGGRQYQTRLGARRKGSMRYHRLGIGSAIGIRDASL